ncbi:MAG: hypothetical protein Q7W55_06650 [Pseudohongiella sp.]|nr:hypothetical protein [Pseudohongiella sp.]MDO9520649.1 hypothetical protein [Pseudohongiella sp.]MDP2127919.1 hypothetical protein [Pseudohongiella sp.]
MTFFNTHQHYTGVTGGYKSLASMPWAQINSAAQVCTRRLQSVVEEMKTKLEVRLT